MSYKQGAQRRLLAVSGGYAEVLENVMTVLAPAAEFGAEIDSARAQRAKERAEKQLAELKHEDQDFELAQVALQRALVRLQVASKEARR
jgi:F-type H+-transporting ATPase subunit epsilon